MAIKKANIRLTKVKKAELLSLPLVFLKKNEKTG
jgi:hypothetical protein